MLSVGGRGGHCAAIWIIDFNWFNLGLMCGLKCKPCHFQRAAEEEHGPAHIFKSPLSWVHRWNINAALRTDLGPRNHAPISHWFPARQLGQEETQGAVSRSSSTLTSSHWQWRCAKMNLKINFPNEPYLRQGNIQHADRCELHTAVPFYTCSV